MLQSSWFQQDLSSAVAIACLKPFAEWVPQAVTVLMGHPRGAKLCSYPGLEAASFLPLGHHSTAPWKALLLVSGVSSDQHGFGAPHSAGEGKGIILQYSHACMGVSPQMQLCAQIQPPTVLATSAQGSLHWNSNSKPHLHLIVQGCSHGRNKDIVNYSWQSPS